MKEQIEEMAECCPYFWNGACTVDAANPTEWRCYFRQRVPNMVGNEQEKLHETKRFLQLRRKEGMRWKT